MAHEKSPSSLCPETVAEFLADREGLAGGARERFKLLLHDYGGFRENSAPRYSRLLIPVSSLLLLAGLVVDQPARCLVWVEYALIAAVLLWNLQREEKKIGGFDRKTDWEAYCLFLRPVILSDHPGLLDRNAGNIGHPPSQSTRPPIPPPPLLVQERGRGFWLSAVLGLWSGMVVLLLIPLGAGPLNWMLSFAFPAGGLLLGWVMWVFWRGSIYAVAKLDSRLMDR